MFTTALTVVGLFVLRVVVPVTITLAAAAWLRRVDAGWSKGRG